MSKPGPALGVAVVEKTAFVKVPGRANYASSLDLKSVVAELGQRGFASFVLDLGECVTMDSTFLGSLAGLVLQNNAPSPQRPHIELLNPNARVLDLIENLGVLDLFAVRKSDGAPALDFIPAPDRPEPTKEEVTRNCLEAHQTLMEINPANIPKFKDVAQFMAEDLKKLTTGK